MKNYTPLADPLRATIGLDKLREISARAQQQIENLRATMLRPDRMKHPPRVHAAQLAKLCAVDPSTITRLRKKGELPAGEKSETNSRVTWSLKEAQQWIRALRPERLRPDGVRAPIICVGNNKGGVAKTTTVMNLAQGLTLRGHRVLVVDMDGQNSLTNLFGIIPQLEVRDDQTILPLVSRTQKSITPMIRTSYWPNLDLVASKPVVQKADLDMTANQIQEDDYEFWDILRAAMWEPARTDAENMTEKNWKEFLSAVEQYDVILLDTAPAMNPTAMTAIMAADGVIVPCPPNMVDFLGSAGFWPLFDDLIGNLLKLKEIKKSFRFVNVLLTKVQQDIRASEGVRRLIMNAYGELVLPVEIPESASDLSGSATLGTVYDLDASSSHHSRAQYERLVDYIEGQVHGFWAAEYEDMLADIQASKG